MGYWTKSESIYFDWILADLFEWLGDYSDACESWTEEKWRSEIEQKMKEKNYRPEDEAAVRLELERFLPVRFKESIWDDVEGEALKGDAVEQIIRENQERSKRKAKQVPQVNEWIKEYQTNKSLLEQKQDETAYKSMLDTCYNIIFCWDTVGCLDEFSGLIDFTERTALAFFEESRTLESLYYLAFFYTDQDLLWSAGNLEWQKEQLLKGVEYARLLYELLNDEESAERYISCYLLLDQVCRSLEDLEQLGYADQAYRIAKEIAVKLPTEKIMELLELAKIAETSFYGMHELKELGGLISDDYEETVRQIKSGQADKDLAEKKPLDWVKAAEFARGYYEQADCSYMRLQEQEGWRVSKPYGDFVIEVMKKLAEEGIESELVYVVAALHNLVEKTECTYELIAQYFTEDVARIVKDTAHREDEDFLQCIQRCQHMEISFQENLSLDILLAEKICKVRLCGLAERVNEEQKKEFQKLISYCHIRNWKETEQMGRELLTLCEFD